MCRGSSNRAIILRGVMVVENPLAFGDGQMFSSPSAPPTDVPHNMVGIDGEVLVN